MRAWKEMKGGPQALADPENERRSQGVADPEGNLLPYDDSILETLETFKNPANTYLIFLDKGRAFHVHQDDAEKLLHLHHSLHPDLIGDHSKYIASLQSAR